MSADFRPRGEDRNLGDEKLHCVRQAHHPIVHPRLFIRERWSEKIPFYDEVSNLTMKVNVEGIELHLAHPDELNVKWVGQEEAMRQLMAAWTVIDDRDVPMNPRLLGKPGVGKTTMAYAAGRRLGREVYILQATVDTRPEDLLITPVIESGSQLKYVASPLVTAMLRGGVAILDEGNRMSEKSWASLAPLLDSRRYVESIVTGVEDPGTREVPPGGDDE